MSEADADIVKEFLIESYENLDRLDRELVALEQSPEDQAALAGVFRTIHTIKGTCGFLGFSKLERVAHVGENLLTLLRDRQLRLNPEITTALLSMVDAVRQMLGEIEQSGQEGERNDADLIATLTRLQQKPATVTAEKQSAPISLGDILMERNGVALQEIRKAAEKQKEGDPRRLGEILVEQGVVRPADVADALRVQQSRGQGWASESTIRVDVGLLEKVMNLVGELVLARNQVLQFASRFKDPGFLAASQRLNLITSELQEGVMKTRMQPIGMVWNKLPRVVRDMAVALGKQIRLDMDGTETELDRTIMEAIKDPLVHLVRNACDHGIEPPEVRVHAGKPPQGRLTLRAYHEGGQVNIELGDDGSGIDVARVKQKAIEKGLLRPEQAQKLSDREAFNLIFQAGFSTAQTVTNVSGRGVGMDVVKSHIEKIGGIVDVFSRSGEGTTVKLKIPLTLAIIPGLVITSGGERFVIPQVSLLELIRLEGDSSEKRIEYVHGTPVYRRRGSLLPIAYLNQVLGLKSAEQAEAVNMVVLQAEDRQFGLVVDGINDTQEIVVKPLGKQLKGITEYAGATIMGDGRVALILDVLGIGQRSGVLAETREQARASAEQQTPSGIEQQRLLLFRAGSFERLAIPLSLVARLEEFPRNSIEHAGGSQVVQYRNQILPLVLLRAVLGCGGPDQDETPDPVQVVVFNDGDRSVGVVVDQILDVAEEEVTVRRKSSRKGLLGSAVVGKRVTDFLDLNQVIHAATDSWFQRAGGSMSGKRILVAEASPFSRGLIRSGLDMAGYRVVEAGNLDEAVRGLEQQPVDVVVAALDLPPDGSSALLAAMRRRPEWEAIPILALADSAEQIQASTVRTAGFQDCQAKFDREAMLDSVARLASALASSERAPVCAGEKR